MGVLPGEERDACCKEAAWRNRQAACHARPGSLHASARAHERGRCWHRRRPPGAPSQRAAGAGRARAAAHSARRSCSAAAPAASRQNEVQSALAKIVTAGFKAVRLIYYFTAGVQEVSCRGAVMRVAWFAGCRRHSTQCWRPCWRPCLLPSLPLLAKCSAGSTRPPRQGGAASLTLASLLSVPRASRRCAAGRSASTPRRRRRRAPSTQILSADSSAQRSWLLLT